MVNRRALGMPTNPPFPWDDNDASKYSLVEIAVEFIMWDAVSDWPDGDRCRFIMLGIEHNFPEDERETKFNEFPQAYDKALDLEPPTPRCTTRGHPSAH